MCNMGENSSGRRAQHASISQWFNAVSERESKGKWDPINAGGVWMNFCQIWGMERTLPFVLSKISSYCMDLSRSRVRGNLGFNQIQNFSKGLLQVLEVGNLFWYQYQQTIAGSIGSFSISKFSSLKAPRSLNTFWQSKISPFIFRSLLKQYITKVWDLRVKLI